MKGTIVLCLEQLVCSKFSREQWQRSLKEAGMNPATMFLPFQDIDDAAVMKVVQAVCTTLNLTLTQAADAFGDYWVGTYSQELYGQYYQRYTTTREFLTALDSIHVTMTKTMQNAHPPRFTYEWKNEKTLIMHYTSQRHLIDFAVGLIKGVGKFYRENVTITKLGGEKIHVTFA